MDKSATIKDIARQLRLSTSTVSRALRGQSDVSKQTRMDVLALAKELDYQPNRMALGLQSKQSHTIGVLVPNLDYFFATAIRGIDEQASEAGYTVIVCQSNESYGREVKNTHRLMESFVDGLIISVSSETNSFDHFKRLQQKEVPMIFFDRDISGISSPKVMLDNFYGGEQATQHLIDLGRKHIAFLGGPKNLSISNERKEGYMAALKASNIKVDEKLIVHCDFNQAYAQVAMEELLRAKRKPDAVFAISDRIAIGAMLAIKERGLSLPNDVALVGFNNEPITALLNPAISSVDQPAFEMGKTAARLFIELLQADAKPNNQVVKFKPSLIIRESSKFK